MIESLNVNVKSNKFKVTKWENLNSINLQYEFEGNSMNIMNDAFLSYISIMTCNLTHLSINLDLKK